MKLPKILSKKELADYSKTELILMLSAFEEQYQSKNEKLKSAHSKLSRAKVRLQSQEKRLRHLRKRVVELTPRMNDGVYMSKV